MPGRPDAPNTPDPARNRCRCGHFPTAHMRVAPVEESGNFRLDPTGPCAVCGGAACRAYTPGL